MFTKSHRNIRVNYNSYMESRTDLSKAIEKVEEFVGSTYMGVLKDLDEYVSGYKSKRRIAIVLISNLTIFVTMLRFCISEL